MRRLSCFALILAILGSGISVPGALSAVYSDAEFTPYQDAVAYLSERQAIHGYGDGQIRPNELLNRAEAIKILVATDPKLRAQSDWFARHMPPLPLWSDVAPYEWYAPSLEAAFAAGIVRGYPDGTFRPEQLLSTEEAIVLLMRAYGHPITAKEMAADWYTQMRDEALAKNVIGEQAVLTAGYAITRGQFFDMVYRMDTVTTRKLVAFEGKSPSASGESNPGAPSFIPRAEARELLLHASDQNFSVTIPALGIKDLTITHPSDALTNEGILAPLKNGVGHLFSYPGRGGKILIYGHSSGFPWDISKFTKIFRTVNKLNTGDRVYVTYDGRLYVYEVTSEKSVPATDQSYLSGDGEQLILFTCWPPDSIAQRYLVFAKPVQTIALK